MSEERFDRLEEMLATLIGKVGRLEGEFKELKTDVKQIREESESRFNTVDKKLDSLLAEQEFIWEKAVRTEREVGKMKNLLQL